MKRNSWITGIIEALVLMDSYKETISGNFTLVQWDHRRNIRWNVTIVVFGAV